MNFDRAHTLLEYNPDSGVLTRRISIRGHNAGSVAGTVMANGYRGITVDGRHYYAHRLAWLMVTGLMPETDIDHVNGLKDDNRLTNLRLATRSQNNGNARRRKDNTSGYKGVSFHPQTEKWRAAIHIKGRKHHIGLFQTPEEAHQAYINQAKQVFGEFAKAA